ncbi:MAG TPA: carboxypeptidase regulatory-like domain-containing protein, partial [Gemmatimonadaceae bacterium]|nr:carboxypeptidase regulatory-like domain-containing protein [Gemmatimonadaceae bacterium]
MPHRPAAGPGGLACSTLAGLLLLAIPAPARAQVGTVVGRVLDSTAGAPLRDVSLGLDGLPRGAVSDARGRFVIPGVAAGTHTLRARLIGYRQEDRVVAVRAGETTHVELSLQREATPLTSVRTEARSAA